MQNIFEKATRGKIRFNFKGSLCTEDLWDLSPEQLDVIYANLEEQVVQGNRKSLLKTRTTVDEETDLKIQIVKHIFGVKADEANARKAETLKREQKQKIMELMANKQDAEMQSKSIEELEKMLAELE